MIFRIKSNLFSGPIDLLLHLVKQRELPIEKVSLAKVASQYLSYVEEVRKLDIDAAAEYLVIAATLLSIKASFLLNSGIEEVPEEEGFDPHAELLRRLREAEVFKEGALKLGGMNLLGQDVFSPPSMVKELKEEDSGFISHDSLLLGEAFRKLLQRTGEPEAVLTIELEALSVVERMMEVLEILRGKDGPTSFLSLIPDKAGRISLIVSFVSLLELCKRGIIWVKQGGDSEKILIGLKTTDYVLDSVSSEFDQAPLAASVNE